MPVLGQEDYGELRVLALDGKWEILGRDRARGVYPTGILLKSDKWGSLDMQFTLNRHSADTVWPDLTADTPVQYWRHGRKQWSGFVREAPSRDALDGFAVNVNCDGLQAHLDDDLYSKVYAHVKMSEWVDIRSQILSVDLTTYTAAGKVVTGDGGIAIGWANGDVVALGTKVGVVLDLGPDNAAKRVVVAWKRNTTAPNANMVLYCRGSDNPGEVAPVEDPTGGFPVAETFSASGLTSGTFTTPRRYVNLFAYWGTGGGTFTEDHFWQITAVAVYTDTAYESGGVSILKGNQIIEDVLANACSSTIIDPDHSQITTGIVALPEYRSQGQDGYDTARGLWEGVNRYEDRNCGLDVEGRPYWTPQPAVAELETRAPFDDASASNAKAIFNKIVGVATGPDNQPVIVKRTSSDQPGAIFDRLATEQPNNPGAEVNLTNWTVPSSGTISRDTVVFDGAGVASVKATTSAGGISTVQLDMDTAGSVTQPLVIGRRYRFSVRIRKLAPMTSATLTLLNVLGGLPPGGVYAPYYGLSIYSSLVTNTWVTILADFVATTPKLVLQLTLLGSATVDVANIDNVQLSVAGTTIPDRRGKVRAFYLRPDAAQTTATLTSLCDIWLRNHQRAAFKGKVRIYPGDCWWLLSGAPLKPADLLRMTGKKIRLSDSRDPDWGSSHRDGTIAAVAYNDEENYADVDLDSERANFAAYQSRQAITQGIGV